MADRPSLPWLKMSLLAMIGKPLVRELDKASRDIRGSQQAVLLRTVSAAANTAFGREHGFAGVRSVDDYRAAVPVRDFEGHRPYVERMCRGEADVLFPGRPVLHNMTSGTCSKPKLIPISREYFETIYSKTNKAWLYTTMRDNPRVWRGKNLSMVSQAVEGRVEDGTPYGSLSGNSYTHIPSVLKDFYSLPYSILCIGDYALKYYGMLRFALATTISYIISTNPSSLLRLHQTVMENAVDLVRDIADGTLRPDVLDAVSPAERPAVLAALRSDRTRARQLEALFKQHGEHLRPKHYWPELACINAWKQGNCGQVLPQLAGYFPDTCVIREFGYQASEARAGLVLDNGWDCSVLAAHLYHFEFIEESDRESAVPPVLQAHELEKGRRYFMLFTNGSGLYRYDIDDLIEVRGFYHQFPLFTFIRKGDGWGNLTGEKLTETQVLEAVERVSRVHGLPVTYFTLFCREEEQRYELFTEFGAGVEEKDKARFGVLVDTELAVINPEYKAKRGSRRLEAPVVRQLPAGSYERIKETLVRRGLTREGQYKTLYLQREPQMLAVYEEVCRSAQDSV